MNYYCPKHLACYNESKIVHTRRGSLQPDWLGCDSQKGQGFALRYHILTSYEACSTFWVLRAMCLRRKQLQRRWSHLSPNLHYLLRLRMHGALPPLPFHLLPNRYTINSSQGHWNIRKLWQDMALNRSLKEYYDQTYPTSFHMLENLTL
jgi:hypothetical protein